MDREVGRRDSVLGSPRQAGGARTPKHTCPFWGEGCSESVLGSSGTIQGLIAQPHQP